MNNSSNFQISVERRIAEAISAKLNFDFLCFRGSIMGEAYLTYSISEILVTFFDQSKFKILNNFAYPSFTSKSNKGRKPEIDYVVKNLESRNIRLAIEAKWAGSSHCSPQNILWDLVRLKILKDSMPSKCSTYFLIAGTKNDMDNIFKHKFFKPGTNHPLNTGTQREKKFNLIKNPDHQKCIDKYKTAWTEKYIELPIPERITTRLIDDTKSAHKDFRFAARIWRIE